LTLRKTTEFDILESSVENEEVRKMQGVISEIEAAARQ